MKPGQSAAPFEDFREILRNLDPIQRTEAIGQSNYRLLESGLATWDDIVTPTRVRALKEVVARKKLSIEAMERAGVSPRFAREAHASVHTPEQVLIRQQRKVLVEQIEKAGLSREQIRDAVARGIHERVSIAAGPSKASPMPPPTRPDRLPEGLKRGFKRFGTGGTPPTAPPAPAPAPKPTPTPASTPRKNLTPADFVAHAKAQGYEVQLMTLEQMQARWGKDHPYVRAAPMFYSDADRRIYLNTAADLFADPDVAGRIKGYAERGWFSAGEPFSVVDHEIGHAKHYDAMRHEGPARIRELKTAFDPETAAKIKRHVSEYAATTPMEFVAEVYAGLKSGKVYPEGIMEYYDSIGGPRP